MRPFIHYLNESIADQLKYFLIPTFGKSEYQSLLDANPVGLLDGLMNMSITTKDKPKNTSPTSLEKTSSGWVSKYTKNHLH